MANVGMPLQFSRMYSGPLDEKDVFESYELAAEYAKSPIGYPGHVIAVKTTDYRRDVYVINDDKTLSHMAVTRADIDVTLEADKWSEEKPYSYRVEVHDLYETDNVVVSMGSESTQEQYDAVINARITNIEQGDGYVVFYCDEDRPEVDITLRLVVGGVINAVELPNSGTVDTKLRTITIHAYAWNQENNTYRAIVPDLLSGDQAVVSIASELADEQIESVLEGDIDVIEQGNGYIILKANGIIPTVDFDMTVAFGTNVVVVPNNTVISSKTYSREITLANAGWVLNSGISTTKYSQTFLLEGMTETVNGSVFIPSTLTDEEIEALMAAEITIVQGDGEITFICNGTIPMYDIKIGITYGANINVIQSAQGFADRTAVAQYASFTLYPDKWVYNGTLDAYVYILGELTDLDTNANGCIGLANNIPKDAEIEAMNIELSVYSIEENTIVITAKECPTLEIPINVIFGSNIVVTWGNSFSNTELSNAEDILYSNDKVVGQTLDVALGYAIEQNPTSTDPSRTIMASVDNIPNGIIMKDRFNGKNYIIRLENGVMTTTELNSLLLPFFNGLKGINYPLNLYRNLDKLQENVSHQCWTSLISTGNVIKSEGKLIYYSVGTSIHERLAIGTIDELLSDIPEICDYTVFDVKSNCYLHAYNGALYYTGGLYDYPENTEFKVHGTIADMPTSADKAGMFYYNTTTGEYYIWDGTSWVDMPTML